MGKRASSVLVAGIFVLGACSGGSTNAEPTSTKPRSSTAAPRSTTTVPRSTTTTSTPEYSFDDSVPPPKIVNTGTNYVAILKSLEGYGNWAAAHRPDPALAARVLAPGSRVLYFFARDLSRLRANGSRLVETPRGSATEYALLSANRDAFSVRVREDVLDHKTVIADGRVTSQRRYPAATYIALVVLSKSRWFLAAFDLESKPNVRL